MKAAQFSEFGGPEVLKYVEVPPPVPQVDQVLVDVSAIGVNFPDVRERMGVYQRAETRVGGVELPWITGLQVVGRVIDVGPATDKRLVGKKVLSLLPKRGGYAQVVVAPLSTTVVLPDDANDIEMATLPCQGVTAYLTLRASTYLREGESVLVHGAAGGVGSFAVQIAKLLGAGKVIATASTEAKREFARGIGADVAIDYSHPDWPKTVLEHTDGHGVDVLLESIGGDVFEQNFDALATFGRYVIFGSTRGPGKPFEPRRLMTKAQTLAGIYLPVYYRQPELVREALQFLVDHALDKTLRVTVAGILPLSEAAEAHRKLEARETIGVLVLDPRQ